MTTAAHYRLTSDEFLDISSKLTDAQLRVYLYYKTLDPFGDRRIEICTKAIAETLNISQRSVQRCLNKLASMGLLLWEKAKSFVRRHGCRQGDPDVATATPMSSRRHQCRERQLELSLGATPETSQSSSILFKLDQDQDDEILNDEEQDENFDSIEEEVSLEIAIAEIRSAIPNYESLDENHDLVDEDLLLNNEDEVEQDIEQDDNAETDLLLNTTGNTDGIADGESFRRRVEDFILKTLNKSPKNRAAYFAKFDAKSWKKWETDYKASLTPQAPYKPYVPEKVEVAAPDSPVAQIAIAMIKAKLGIKS